MILTIGSSVHDPERSNVHKLKIQIVVPTKGINSSKFTQDFASMIGFSVGTLGMEEIADLGMTFCEGTYIVDQRNQLVQEALTAGATHLLWLDTDMRFPKDILLRLLHRNRPIVGVNYATRAIPVHPTAAKHTGLGEEPAEWLYNHEDETGLAPVESVGFGAVLVQAKVYRDLSFPWFNAHYDERMTWIGEDTYFCSKARAAGYDVMVDLDLSEIIRHIGDFEYELAHARAITQEDHNGSDDLHAAPGSDRGLVEPVGSHDANP